MGLLEGGSWEAETFGPLHMYGIHGENDNSEWLTEKKADEMYAYLSERNPDRTTLNGSYISTYTGRFYPFSPRAEDVRIEDIAHGLANLCRYTGACIERYSVAEHSVHVAGWLYGHGFNAETVLVGLLHDSPEALSGFGDVARPAKMHAPIIKQTETNIWRKAVAPAFGLPIDIPVAVHEADNRIITDEMQQNMHECDPDYTEPLGVTMHYWSPAEAEAQFLGMFRKLTARVAA